VVAAVADVNKSGHKPLSIVGRQALSDVTPRILYQQAMNDVTPRSSHSVVSATASDLSVKSQSSTSQSRSVSVLLFIVGSCKVYSYGIFY